MAGAPKGNRNAVKGRRWANAIERALEEEYKSRGISKGQALFEVAKKIVGLALDGNKDAIQEIGNRLDGKAHQQVTVDGTQTIEHVTVRTVDRPGLDTATWAATDSDSASTH